jgi:PilZ domain
VNTLVTPRIFDHIPRFYFWCGESPGIESSRGRSPIAVERHRAPRHEFIAIIEVTDLQSELRVNAHTKDLNLFGCFVETPTPFLDGTKVRLRITRGSANVFAVGKVAYSRPGRGMGVQFLSIEPSSLPTLEGWLNKLRT